MGLNVSKIRLTFDIIVDSETRTNDTETVIQTIMCLALKNILFVSCNTFRLLIWNRTKASNQPLGMYEVEEKNQTLNTFNNQSSSGEINSELFLLKIKTTIK